MTRVADIFPAYRGIMEYVCLGCGARRPAGELLYTCPDCGGVFLLEDSCLDDLRAISGKEWQERFDSRAGTRNTALRGIFRFYELMAPVVEPEDIVYLGEGNTPIVEASPALSAQLGVPFGYKNDGQNPSGSFKDRGMACAFSYLKSLIRTHKWDDVLTVCASTGDTSAAAALYAAYVGAPLRSVVLLPHGKVTPQQLSQPLGSGATVLELPGVFDDCMKVVEQLAESYRIALLNSKNSWRILGQESYAYELAQWYGWDMRGQCLFVPIGNAGNITAIMSGFLKMLHLNIIDTLPRIFGVQSEHADPVFQYYHADSAKRQFKAVKVQPSVAQAAMIGNPVSFPRVQTLVEKYLEKGGARAFQVLQVTEQAIMDAMLDANSHGHIACTQGGECLAGLKEAIRLGSISPAEHALLDATAHALKFSSFQDMYFANTLPASYGVHPDPQRIHQPELVLPLESRAQLDDAAFTRAAAEAIIAKLHLKEI